MKSYILCVDILVYGEDDNLLFVPDLVFFSDSLKSLLEINGLEFYSIVKDYVNENYCLDFSIFDFTYECNFGDTSDESIKSFLKDIENSKAVICFER